MSLAIIDAAGNISAALVFLAGLLSFFSPCVIPLIPLYVGYLAGGARTTDEEGNVQYRRPTVLLHTLFFILGISAAFFLLGAAFTTLGSALDSHRYLLLRVGAVLIIFFGIWMLLPNKGAAAQTEKRFKMPQFKKMNPLVALAMGFLFSFAWTPCVGPILSSVLIMAANATTTGTAFFLIGVYTLGFVIPFLLLGLFTGTVLNWLKKHSNALQWTVKAGGVLLIVIGLTMLTGVFNSLTSPLSRFTGPDLGISKSVDQKAEKEEGQTPKKQDKEAPANNAAANKSQQHQQSGGQATSTQAESDKKPRTPAPAFTLVDQNGVTHTLDEYRGKFVVLNFWTTWCTYCKVELPELQNLYTEYGKNEGDVVFLTVANPSTPEQRNSDGSEEQVVEFAKHMGLTLPILMDKTSETSFAYRIRSFPTTYFIAKDGTLAGYTPGAVPMAMMKNIIEKNKDL